MLALKPICLKLKKKKKKRKAQGIVCPQHYGQPKPCEKSVLAPKLVAWLATALFPAFPVLCGFPIVPLRGIIIFCGTNDDMAVRGIITATLNAVVFDTVIYSHFVWTSAYFHQQGRNLIGKAHRSPFIRQMRYKNCRVKYKRMFMMKLL